MSPTDCSDETRRLNIARRFGSAIISNTDSHLLIYATGNMRVKAYISEEAKMKPASGGYADVNGIKLYHEIYGQGEPLVLIHGGLTTIGEMQGWVQPLAKTRQVIAVEMQGHGRTPDTDRPMTFVTMGDDMAALLDHLKIPKADLVGHSFGGASAIRAAIQHP